MLVKYVDSYLIKVSHLFLNNRTPRAIRQSFGRALEKTNKNITVKNRDVSAYRRKNALGILSGPQHIFTFKFNNMENISS